MDKEKAGGLLRADRLLEKIELAKTTARDITIYRSEFTSIEKVNVTEAYADGYLDALNSVEEWVNEFAQENKPFFAVPVINGKACHPVKLGDVSSSEELIDELLKSIRTSIKDSDSDCEEPQTAA